MCVCGRYWFWEWELVVEGDVAGEGIGEEFG